MIFETLHESARRGELLLVSGGFCHWHLRKDNQLTIREILVLPILQNRGIGTGMLEVLKKTESATSIFAKCPVDLKANLWYQRKGFELEETEMTKLGRKINHWRLVL